MSSFSRCVSHCLRVCVFLNSPQNVEWTHPKLLLTLIVSELRVLFSKPGLICPFCHFFYGKHWTQIEMNVCRPLTIWEFIKMGLIAYAATVLGLLSALHFCLPIFKEFYQGVKDTGVWCPWWPQWDTGSCFKVSFDLAIHVQIIHQNMGM